MSGPRLTQQRHSRAGAKIDSSPYVDEIAQRLVKGQSCNAVARWLTEECSEFEGQTLRAVAKQVARWWHLHEGEARQTIETRKAIAIEEITKLEELATLQKARIDQAREKEKELPVLFKSLGPEIQGLKAIYHLLIDKKQSLGLYKRTDTPVPGVSLTQNNVVQNNQTVIVTGASERVQKVLNDPQSRRKVLNVLLKLTQPQRGRDEALAARFRVGAGQTTVDVQAEPAEEPARAAS